MFSYTKITSFQIQNNIIETDSGLFFEDKSSTEFLSLLETSTDSTNNHYYDKDRVIFVIYSSNISNYTFRKYIKVPDILASLGGLTDILCFIFGLINFPFCEINRNCGVIDLLFKHDELKKPNNSINFQKNYDDKKSKFSIKNDVNYKSVNNISRKISMENLSKLTKKSINSNHYIQTNLNYLNKNMCNSHYTNNVFLKYKEYLKLNKFKKSSSTFSIENELLNFSMTKYDKLNIVCRKIKKCQSNQNQKIILYEKFIPYIENLFDYSNVLKVIKEFEYFKKIYFTENQQKIFSLIKIKLCDQDNKVNLFNSLPKNEENINEILRNYMENSEIDKKILNFLH